MGINHYLTTAPGIRDGQKEVGDVLTNPSDGTVLADTGALDAGRYLFGFIISSSASAVADIQHRNAGNSANNDAIRIRTPAGTEYPIFTNNVRLAANERIRVVTVGAFTGDIQATIFYLPVA